jgi:hypothetical protein
VTLTEPAESLDVPLATHARRGNWWPVAAMATGLAFVLLALLPAIFGGPTNPYAAVGLILLGLVGIGTGVALAAYDVAGTRLPGWVSAAIALAAAVPVWIPMFLPMGSDFGAPMLYVLAVGTITFAVRRTVASGVFLLLTALGPAIYVLQQLGAGVGR